MSHDLRSEIRQTRPFRSLEEEAVLNLHRTFGLVAQRQADLLRTQDLTPTQYNVLRILRGAGPGGLPAGEIGERMLTRVPDVTRLIDRLEKQGLVGRERTPQDRRVVRVVITAPGLDVLQALDQPMADLQAGLLGHLGEEKLRLLIHLLEESRRPA